MLLDAMCLVITLTHVNYKLLVLYRIYYRIYTRSQIKKIISKMNNTAS